MNPLLLLLQVLLIDYYSRTNVWHYAANKTDNVMYTVFHKKEPSIFCW